MRMSLVKEETTMTTCKNNFCDLGATAPGFQNAARLRGEKQDVLLASCSSCFKSSIRTGENGDAPQKEGQLQNGLRTALRGLKRQVGTDPSKAAERQRMWGQPPHAMSCPSNGAFRPSRLKTRRNRGRFVREPEIFVFWRRFVQI